MTEQKVSELFLNNIYVLPLWVKQVIYLKTKEKLTDELAEFLDLLNPENLMQHYVPELTFKGKRELEKRELACFDENYKQIKYESSLEYFFISSIESSKYEGLIVDLNLAFLKFQL